MTGVTEHWKTICYANFCPRDTFEGDPPVGWGKKPYWGNIQIQIQQRIYFNREPTYVDVLQPLTVFVPRKEVWKDLPYHGLAEPAKDRKKDWRVFPTEYNIKREKCKSMPEIWSSKTAARDEESTEDLDDLAWAQIQALVGMAVPRFHFQYFDRVMITRVRIIALLNSPQLSTD